MLRLEMPAGMHRRRREILERLRGKASEIEYADVTVLLFEVEDFECVVDLLQPRKRRKLSPQHREAAVERLKRVRERKKVG